MSLKIVSLMSTEPESRDLGWLQSSLQAALELELATLPVYLCGQWALTDQSSPAAQIVQRIVFNEMTHFGLACNLLGATGVRPSILAGYDVIAYPGQLPGGVRPKCDPDFFPCDPNFQVQLGFSGFKAFAQMAMQIEYPEDPVHRVAPLAAGAGTYPSIGEFYDAILQAFTDLAKKVPYETKYQLPHKDMQVFVVNELPEAKTAISTIQQQGEGAKYYPYQDPSGTQLAHFYQFGELYFGKKYVYNPGASTDGGLDW